VDQDTIFGKGHSVIYGDCTNVYIDISHCHRRCETVSIDLNVPLIKAILILSCSRTVIASTQVLEEYKQMIADTSSKLENQLEQLDNKLLSVTLQENTSPDRGSTERGPVQQEIDSTMQCLNVCETVSKHVASKRRSVFENITSEGNSVIVTMGELLSVSCISAKPRSQSILGQMSDDSLLALKGRYGQTEKKMRQTDEALQIERQHGSRANMYNESLSFADGISEELRSFYGAHNEIRFDSGIGSMPDAVSNCEERDDDARSVRSVLTNASRILLPEHEEEHLISAFVGDLYQDMASGKDSDELTRMSNFLPDLLKSFTQRLEKSVNSQMERDATEFVRQQRK
jgi:hypothetical protein